MRLERPMVVRAALDLLNEVGLDGLTTRRLADALGVQGPALYWHFKNKQELIDEMSRTLLSESYGPLRPDQDWARWLMDGARNLRRIMLSYRDSARLIAGYRPTGPHGRVDPPEAFFSPLKDAGFAWPDAAWAVITVAQFTFGFTMDEQAASNREPKIEGRLDSNQGFEFGVATIIAGLRTRLAAHADDPAPTVLG